MIGLWFRVGGAGGYPRRTDRDRWLARKWKGVRVKTIQHDEFGPDPVKVFAVDVSEGL